MKPTVLLLLILLTWSLAPLAHAQTAPATAPKTPAPVTSSTSTVVTSDQFKLDMPSKQGLFSGNVVVTGTDFKMKAREMQVFFDDNNKIKRMIARGSVETEQPDRTSKSGQLDYSIPENKIILTESPQVIQNRNTVTGNTITIYRDTNRMDVDGHNRMILYENENTPAAK